MTHEPMPDRGATSRPSGRYRTTFPTDEEPISEGGLWLNGASRRHRLVRRADPQRRRLRRGDADDVAERRVEQATAAGPARMRASQPEGDYDDPPRSWPGRGVRNQHCRATVFSRNPTDDYFQEVEIRLRSSIAPNCVHGYEVFWRCSKSDGGVCGDRALERQDRRLHLARASSIGPRIRRRHGDIVEATIVGNVIRSYINGVEVMSAVDDAFDDRGARDRLQLLRRRHQRRPRLLVLRGRHVRRLSRDRVPAPPARSWRPLLRARPGPVS